MKRDANGFCSGFFFTASILDGCGDLGYLFIDQREKRQMWGQDVEKMKIEGERKKGLVWAVAEEVNLGLGLHFTVPFAFSIYTRSFLALFLNFMGSRFGSPVLVVKPKPNRTGKIFGLINRFNQFFISVRFSRLIFHRFFRLFDFFKHP